MTLQKTLRGVAISALFLVPIFPLIVANSMFFPFITGKAFYFRILVELAFAAWAVLALLDAKYRPKLSLLTVGITVFALVALVADLLGVNPLRSLWSNFERMEGWITVVHLWALFIVASSVFGAGDEGKRLWHRWFNFEMIIAIVVGLYGVGQLFGWFAIHQGSTRIDASLGNAAYMAVYMLWNTGLAAYMFTVAKARKIGNAKFLMWAYPVLAVFFAFLLIETATRGTIIGLVGGIMVALAVYAIWAPKARSRSRSVSGGIVIGLIVLIGAFIGLRHQPWIAENPIFGRLANISLSSSETTARLYIWHMALIGASQRPVLGWGQENFNYIFNANYDAHMWSQEQWFDRAHSVYLDWLTASGAVGLLSYLSLYVILLVALWKSDLTIGEKSILTGLVVGYAVHNVFVFDNLASYVPFFMMLGFAGSLYAGKPLRALGTKAISRETVEYIALPAVIVILVFVLYFCSYRPFLANTRLIAALQNCGDPTNGTASFQSALSVNVYLANQEIREQALSCASNVIGSQQLPASVKQDYFALANKAIQDQIAATPRKDARIYTLGGSFLNQVGQFAEAASLLETAHELSPAKQSTDLELLMSLMNTGKVPEGVALMAAAYASDPSDGQARDAYVLALIANGEEAKARQLFGNDLALFKTAQAGQAFMIAKQYAKAVAVFADLFAASPTDMNTGVELAQTQFAGGMFPQALQTLNALEKAHPEYKSELDAAIQQVTAAEKR